MKRWIRYTLVVLPVALLAAGCGGEEQAARDTERTGDMTRQRIGQARSGLPTAVAAKLDSGNAAYRAGDYERALELYRTAADENPDAAAAWFGVYMAYNAMGRDDSARAALERAGGLSESGGAFHGTSPTDTGGSMPNPHEGGGMMPSTGGGESPDGGSGGA